MSLSDFDPTKGAKKLNNARKKIFTDPLLDTAESIFKEADRFVESDLGKAVIVGAALYLASDSASFTTGAIIAVDGGSH